MMGIGSDTEKVICFEVSLFMGCWIARMDGRGLISEVLVALICSPVGGK